MPFKKGQKKIGGRKKGTRNKETIKKEVITEYLVDEVIRERKPLIQALIQKGKKGEVKALNLIFDRVLGKVTEKFEYDLGQESLKELESFMRLLALGPPKLTEEQKGKMKPEEVKEEVVKDEEAIEIIKE